MTFRRTYRQWILIFSTFAAFAGVFRSFSATAPAEQAFQSPPPAYRPWVHWFWMDGNISRQGITADLEAMQRVGIGGAILMDVSQQVPAGPIQMLSKEWIDLFRHSVDEAQRLGLEFSAHNAPGWSGSGGPWITPELSMQRLVWSRTNLIGPCSVRLPLPKLPSYHGFSGEVCVLAFPTLTGDGAPVPGVKPSVTCSFPAPAASAQLSDANPRTVVTIPLERQRTPAVMTLSYPEEFLAGTLLVQPGTPGTLFFSAELLGAGKDGKFRHIRDVVANGPELLLEFPPTVAKSFRLVFKPRYSPGPIDIGEMYITPVYRVASYQAKAGMARGSKPDYEADVPVHGLIQTGRVADVTSRTTNGVLTWDVPPGQWTIMRFGHISTGRMNPPAREGGAGLECDKLSKEAAEVHFSGFMGRLLQLSPEGALRHMHIDSWEVGLQNWTPKFREEFEQRRGYDPLLYLPAFSGRYMQSAEVTERFLWDVRRCIADMLADNYAGHLRALANQHGIKLSAEAYGNGPMDDLLYASRVDVPMSEFWNEGTDYTKFHTSKSMASVAHVYGKEATAAESFTSWPATAKWQQAPESIKTVGDTAFSYGVSRLVFHRFAHQPYDNMRPGMTMGMWGLHYDRTQTWWEYSKPWHEYIARCQYMLRTGRFGAEVCYITDQGAFTSPPAESQLPLALPEGAAYDFAPPDALFSRFQVEKGRVITADGTSYRVLVLNPSARMTPQLARRVSELVSQGALVLGPPPARSPSLAGYPDCDAEVQKIAREVWGDCDGKQVKEHRYGKGRVVWGKTLAEVLREQSWIPAFTYTSTGSSKLAHIRRVWDAGQLHFIANAETNSVTVDCTFASGGHAPELWDPETGRIVKLARWKPEPDIIRLPLQLGPRGSVFLVFRGRADGLDPVVDLQRNSLPCPDAQVHFTDAGVPVLHANEPGSYRLNLNSGKRLTAEVQEVLRTPLNTTWTVQFHEAWGPPEPISFPELTSWSAHTDPRIRYYSGSTTYKTHFAVDEGAKRDGRRVWLDLGGVKVACEVRVNDHSAGTLWKAPFRCDVTEFLRPGTNELSVRVANLWPNRLIRDEQLPQDSHWTTGEPGATGNALLDWPEWLKSGQPRTSGRVTFATRRFYDKNSPLLPSGLLGPVTLSGEAIVVLQ